MIQEYFQLYKLPDLNLSSDFLKVEHKDLIEEITKVMRQEKIRDITMQLYSDRMPGFDEENKSKQIKISGKWISFSGISCATYKNPLTIQCC